MTAGDKTPTQFDTLFEDEFCEVRADPRHLEGAQRIILTFTGIGQELGGIEVQDIEFVGSASRNGAAVFVTDRTRSWGNRLDFTALKAVLSPHLEGRTVFTLGNSMGGFLAILATSFFPVQVAIAFSPQFSVHPAVVPRERRWRDYRRAITEWRYPSLAKHVRPGTEYYLFYGDHFREEIQYRLFADVPNLHRYIFPGRQHNIAAVLKRRGLLDKAIAGCVARTFTLADIESPITAEAYEIGADRA